MSLLQAHRGPLARSRLRELADEDLMARVRDGEMAAFEAIYDRHASVAYSLAYRICGTRSGAEEVVQEAFLALWRNGERYDRARGSVRTWVLGIVHNRAVDALRRSVVHERRRAGDDGLAERLVAAERTETQVVAHDEAREIRAALDSLPEEQAHVIELAYFGGFTHTEIAELLGAPVGTIKGRMRLGLEKLRGALELSGALAIP
jgi:RNA polymerase sigma-70 factor (ECF subfamily)